MDRLRQIEMVVRAADTGSFAKAAATLDVTPSAMSHAITQLEKQLRTALFYRTTRQLHLTEDGELFCRRGREILDRLADMEAATRGGTARLSGKLRVGTRTGIAQHVIMPRLAEFLRQHPGLSIELRQRWRVKDMHAEGMDVLTWVGDVPAPGVIAHRLCDLQVGIYAAPSYLSAMGSPQHPRDLLRHRCLVFYPQIWDDKPLDSWAFERRGEREVVKVNPLLYFDERETLISAALNGLGLIRTGLFDPALITSGRLRRVLEDWTCVGGLSLYAMYRKSQRQSPKIAAFLAFMRDAAAAFDPQGLTVTHQPAARPVRRTH